MVQIFIAFLLCLISICLGMIVWCFVAFMLTFCLKYVELDMCGCAGIVLQYCGELQFGFSPHCFGHQAMVAQHTL